MYELEELNTQVTTLGVNEPKWVVLKSMGKSSARLLSLGVISTALYQSEGLVGIPVNHYMGYF